MTAPKIRNGRRFRPYVGVLTAGRIGRTTEPFTTGEADTVEVAWSSPNSDPFWPEPGDTYYTATTETVADVLTWRQDLRDRDDAKAEAWWANAEAAGGERVRFFL